MKTRPARRHRQAGLSMVEMMLSIALGLMVTAAMGYVLLGSRTSASTQQANARLQENGRYVMEVLGRNIRNAGTADITPLYSDARMTFSGGPALAITGTDGSVLVTDDGVARATDTLIVSYDNADLSSAASDDDAGDDENDIVDCLGNRLIEPIYSAIEPNRAWARVENTLFLDADDLELHCDGNGGGAPSQPLFEGVVDMQFTYGIDTNADQSVDAYVAVPADFSQVITVRACVLLRSEDGALAAAQDYQDCSGTVRTAGDRRLRRAFTSTFSLRNRILALPL